MLKMRHFLIALTLIAILPSTALAEGAGFGLGWQYTGPTSGVSLKLPLDRYLVLQPMLSLSLQDQASGAMGRIGYGLRAMMNLPGVGPLHPYAGVGVGRYTRFDAGKANVTQGYHGFAGLEYALGNWRPSLEVAMGQVAKPDGSKFMGTMFNFGCHYYF